MILPDLLSVLRLALAPVLLSLAWTGLERTFVAALALAYLTDAIDGPIARRFGGESRYGPKLDTWADVTIYLCVPLGAWWLWPDLIRREVLYIALIVTSILLPLLAGLIKFRATTSYHTLLVKIAAICTTLSSLLLFLQITALPFRVSAVLCLLAGMEEVLITRSLREPRSNVRSIWYVLRNR